MAFKSTEFRYSLHLQTGASISTSISTKSWFMLVSRLYFTQITLFVVRLLPGEIWGKVTVLPENYTGVLNCQSTSIKQLHVKSLFVVVVLPKSRFVRVVFTG